MIEAFRTLLNALCALNFLYILQIYNNLVFVSSSLTGRMQCVQSLNEACGLVSLSESEFLIPDRVMVGCRSQCSVDD